ncbi:hypothetical protein BH11MYX4_BH11MYX4_35070 [soil metagenome]
MSRRHRGLAARSRLSTPARHLIAGALLLAAGMAVSLSSTSVVWYGAVIVGVIELGRGLHLRARGAPR